MIGKPTTPRRILVPYLILRSAAERHSILAGSVMSALLSLVLCRKDKLKWENHLKRLTMLPIDGSVSFLGENGDWSLVAVLFLQLVKRLLISKQSIPLLSSFPQRGMYRILHRQ